MSKIDSKRNIQLPLTETSSGRMTITPLWFINSIISQIKDEDPNVTDTQISYRICDALYRYLEANKFAVKAEECNLLFEDEGVNT